MPELILSEDDKKRVSAHPATIENTFPRGPYQAFEQEQKELTPPENIFHPVKAIRDILDAIEKQTKHVALLYNQMLLERTFSDEVVGMGSTLSYEVDYKDRKYLYMYSPVALTLNSPSGTPINLLAGQWTNVSLPRGGKLTVSGGNDASPTMVQVRHCDVPMPGSIFNVGNNVTLNNSATNPMFVADVGQAVTLVSNSATVTAAASGNVHLASVAGKTTYIRGFTITAGPAAAVVTGVVTLTGPANTLSYEFDLLVANQSILTQYFGEDGIPASAPATDIVLNLPAITGGSACALVVWGYQL